MIVLSYLQVAPILQARDRTKERIVTSLDLSLSQVEVEIETEGARFPSGELLAWEDAQAIARSEQSCFVMQEDGLHKIQVFSEYTNRHYSLYPTSAAPTLLISGIPMHRIKGTDPHRDTLSKIKAIRPVTGRVLDTTTGLGYTAIEAARTAEQVITIELDPAVLDVARLNPWSQALFTDPKITRIVGDSFDEIEQFEAESFSRIIHDPPMFSLAGDLYSEAFYRQLFRALQSSGRVFHYIGDLNSKSGAGTAKGVVRRLQSAGFARVVRRPEAFGLVAYKRA